MEIVAVWSKAHWKFWGSHGVEVVLLESPKGEGTWLSSSLLPAGGGALGGGCAGSLQPCWRAVDPTSRPRVTKLRSLEGVLLGLSKGQVEGGQQPTGPVAACQKTCVCGRVVQAVGSHCQRPMAQLGLQKAHRA